MVSLLGGALAALETSPPHRHAQSTHRHAAQRAAHNKYTRYKLKAQDRKTDLSSLLSSATGENIEASASIEFDQDRLKLVSEIPTQILQKIMNINPAGKIAYRSLDMAIMKAMSDGNPELAKKMKKDTVSDQKPWWKFW